MTEQEQLTQLQRTVANQTETVTKLLIICEANGKAVSTMEKWIDTHNHDYYSLRERVMKEEMNTDNLLTTISHLASTIAKLNITVDNYVAASNQFKGGWWIVAKIGAVIVGVVTMAKYLGLV